MMNRLLLFTAIFIFSSVVHAQPGKPVRLKHSTLYPVFNVTQGYIDSFNTYLVQAGGAAIAVIQFDAIPSEADRKTLGAAGVELLDYIPEHAYSASITKRLDKNLLLGVRARSLVRLQPAQKMDKYLARGIVPLWSVKVAGTMDAWISFPKSYSTGEVSTLFRQKNIDVVSQDYAGWRILVIRFAPARMQEIAALPFVEYLQAAPPKDQTLNRNSRSASRAGMLNASVANGGKGLNGENVVVGIGDNADIQNHVDFTGRLINRAGTFISSHGQHVSGTVGGGGIINELHRGYAPKATIVSQYFSRILVNAATYVNDFGMVITNNSYGDIIECDYHGTYDLTSRVLDQMAYDLPNLQNIFAAGNSGNSTCAPFATGFRTVLGSYQTAKNVITVGAASDSGFIAGFSSKGPVRDGRIKPEIAAMGQGVISTVPNNSYGSNNGTSMASPGVSGGVALLYQRYRQLHAGANPKNALIKALLVNGATDRGNEGPDYQYGFGLMNLWRSVKMMEDNTYFTGSSTQAVTSTHTISVPANTAQLKVLLYWNDPAAALVSSQALVNDLDLEVTTPSLATILPRILDTAIANVGNTATSGVDRINNIEQVIINNPAAGTYTLKVKGSTIAQNPSQEYFLVYDAIPVHLEVTGPAGGQPLVPGELAKISWDAYGFSSGTVLLEYSLNNGSSWSTIASGININRFNYSWWVPAASTVEALVRVTKEGTGETATSQRFTILGQPVVSLATVQCEDYISISWTPVAGASDYEVMMLRSDSMQQVTLTAATSHLFTGLSKDSTYWVSVRARMNGTAGRRANAVSRKPDSGTCAGTISDNDMKVDAIVSPVTGRQFTSSQLSATAAVSVRVKNLDDAATGNFDVSYSVNGGAWITETVSTPLAAGASYTHTFSATADMATTGTYNIVAVVTNQAADAIAANDTLRAAIRHIANQPLNLVTEFLDNLESADASEYIRDITGMGGAERYDLTRNTVYGRARTFINSGIAWSGNRAITLDVDRYATGNINYLYGTFNLVNYNVTANDIRLDFRYLNQGQGSNAANQVWIRGSDADAWIAVYDLYANQLDPGSYRKTSSIELSDLLAANGQVFTPSFQVRWGQAGVLAASDRSSSSGYTFDDIRLYEVFNDVQLLSLDSPFVASCGLTNATGIRVTVRNSASSALTNVPVRYRINNNAWISEVIPSIAANTTVQYTFAATADFSAYGPYTVQALVDYSADSFHDNDTLTTTVHHAPVISTFPYLQNFEAGNGFWFTGGRKSSWEYGTPASTKINGAASGSRAWKTTLEGGYHDDELSYLYSPCFDVTGMTTPTLSFSVALDIEDCGATLCDAAWVEYSADGISWTKLGASGSGTNWYNKASGQLWSIQNYTRWHVATIPLPAGLNRMRIRFVMSTDPGVTREGIAIDDIHIYDNTSGIYDGVTMSFPVTQNTSGNSWIHFTSNGKLVASVQPQGQGLGATAVQAYISPTVRNTSSQYYHNRNITIKPVNRVLTDSVTVRFYFLDSETEALINASGCASCTKPSSAYQLGVSKYTDADTTFENGTISDNQQGTWEYIAATARTIVPFDKGYYAEFRVKRFSEFWLNNGGFDQGTPLPVKLLQFTAEKTSGLDVVVQWDVASQTLVNRYEVELALTEADVLSNNFVKIGEVAAVPGTGNLHYEFTDTDPAKFATRYYRLKIVNQDGSFQYSAIRSVTFADAVLEQVYPNPSTGKFFLVYQLNPNERITARVYDAKARLVKVITFTGTGMSQKFEIDLSQEVYATGVYLLHINLGSGTRTYKLYKE